MQSAIKKYLSLVKFSHTIFAMPFALVGFMLALLQPLVNIRMAEEPWKLVGSARYSDAAADRLRLTFILVLACMVLARSAAMAFNRWLDRRFDARNPRTAVREIPAGAISARSALFFTILCCVLFVVCCWFINPICFYLSFVALAVVLGYSYTKRFTALCHLVLGVGLALAPIGAYLAVTGEFAVLPLLFSLAVLFWVSGFDIIYALQDEEFDKANQLHSIPAATGRVKALRISQLLHLCSATCVIVAGWYGHFQWLYWIGAAFFAGLLIYQHLLVKPHDLRRVNLAFFTTNGIASIIFAVFVIGDLTIL